MTKRCAVEPVGEVGPRCSDERAADDRRHRPTDVLARLDERVRARRAPARRRGSAGRRRRPGGRSRSQALRSPPGRRSVRALARTATCRRRAARTRSETIIRPRRETRSSSGPRKSPTATAGRNSAIIRTLTHEPELVRSLTSTTSATVASSVPKLEPSVARNRRRKPGAVPRRLNWRRKPVTAAESVRKPLRPFSPGQALLPGTRGRPASRR